eukprot:3564271-Pyramimonas_sp.AAC.1
MPSICQSPSQQHHERMLTACASGVRRRPLGQLLEGGPTVELAAAFLRRRPSSPAGPYAGASAAPAADPLLPPEACSSHKSGPRRSPSCCRRW